MRVKQTTLFLVALATLLAFLGLALDVPFYALGALVIVLYVALRLFAFRAVAQALTIELERRADKDVAKQRDHVVIEVTLSSNLNIKGVFADVIPDDVFIVEGPSLFELVLRQGEAATVRYTAEPWGRQGLRIAESTFTVESELFANTLFIRYAPLDVKPPEYNLNIDSGATGEGGEVLSVSSAQLFRRRESEDVEFAGIRPYEHSDPMKIIHWKASARLQKLMSKELVSQFESLVSDVASPFSGITSDRGATVNIAINQGRTMSHGASGGTGLDFAVSAAGYLVALCIERGLHTSLTTYDTEKVVTSVRSGDSPSHAAIIAKSLNELRPSAVPTKPLHPQMGITHLEVQHFLDDASRKVEEDDDAAYFRALIEYLYRHEEGYRDYIERASAFQAITRPLSGPSHTQVLVLISDLKDDFDPVTEGLSFATERGAKAFVIALFSETFEQYEDRLYAAEALYETSEQFELCIKQLQAIPHVKVISVNSPSYLAPIVKRSSL